LALFRVVKSSISAVQLDFRAWFDSRQLHRKSWSGPKALASFLFDQHLINIGRLSSHLASVRPGTRRDGSTYVQVLYRLDGKQSSTSFEELASAKKFQKLVDKFGPAKALETLGADSEFSAITG
jgi:hypothetical protein